MPFSIEQASVKTSGSIEKFACTLLREQHQKIKNYGKTPSGLNVSKPQSLRKIIKKQYYATELFASLYPNNRICQYLMPYKLQDIIDAINSYEVIKKLFNEVKINQKKLIQK